MFFWLTSEVTTYNNKKQKKPTVSLLLKVYIDHCAPIDGLNYFNEKIFFFKKTSLTIQFFVQVTNMWETPKNGQVY